MAGSSNTDSHSLSREGSKWMVSIAGAVVAGAFTQYEKVLLLPVWLKIIFLFAIFFFLCITILGVFQFYWLNRASNQETRANEPTLTAAERSAASDGLRQAKDQVKNYHWALTGCFAAATLFLPLRYPALCLLASRRTNKAPSTSSTKWSPLHQGRFWGTR